MKVICSDLRCKYRNDGKCSCKSVELVYWNINTLFEGRKDMLECKSFEYDKEYLEMAKKLKQILDKENKDGER